MRNYGCLALVLFLGGCGGPEKPVPKSDPQSNLNSLVSKLKTDKTASPGARSLASDVMQQIKSDQDMKDFAAGK